LSEDAEEWLYEDVYNADLATMEDKDAAMMMYDGAPESLMTLDVVRARQKVGIDIETGNRRPRDKTLSAVRKMDLYSSVV
jgi:hypothetical protein